MRGESGRATAPGGDGASGGGAAGVDELVLERQEVHAGEMVHPLLRVQRAQLCRTDKRHECSALEKRPC